MRKRNPRRLPNLPSASSILNTTMSDSMTTTLLKNLMEYARDRLVSGVGIDVLQAFDADIPEFVQVYGLGFLPEGFRNALDAHARRLLAWSRIEYAIVVPAFDESGVVVDLLAVHPHNRGRMHVNLNKRPQGLIAPVIATAFNQLILTDSLILAAKLFRSGQKNVLLVRGVDDVRNNVQRLRSCGVLGVRVGVVKDAEEVISIFSASGIIAVTETFETDSLCIHNPESNSGSCDSKDDKNTSADFQNPRASSDAIDSSVPSHADAGQCCDPSSVALSFPDKPVLKFHNEKRNQAVFEAADAIYRVETGAGTRFQVSLERGGNVHIDRFDLAVDAQRTRFASSAALRTHIPNEIIEQHLLHLLRDVRLFQREEQCSGPPVTSEIQGAEKQHALDMLGRDDLLDVIAADLEALGWAGEERAKRLLYLAAISRKLATPLSMVRILIRCRKIS